MSEWMYPYRRLWFSDSSRANSAFRWSTSVSSTAQPPIGIVVGRGRVTGEIAPGRDSGRSRSSSYCHFPGDSQWRLDEYQASPRGLRPGVSRLPVRPGGYDDDAVAPD